MELHTVLCGAATFSTLDKSAVDCDSTWGGSSEAQAEALELRNVYAIEGALFKICRGM